MPSVNEMTPVQTLDVATTGSAGSATGSGTFEKRVRGKIKSIDINYNGSAPATTDVTISYTAKAGNTVNLVVASNSNTDAHLRPKQDTHDDAAAAISANYDEWEFEEWTAINVAVAQADALDPCVTIGIEMDDESVQRFWDGEYNP